jgi:putative ABC transport system permease protein
MRMTLPVQPILAALRHHRSATTLIVLQIALTLAIVCNALFIVQQRVAHMSRPTGIDEANIGVIHNQWLGEHGTKETGAMIAGDLGVLQQLPGVVDAYADNTYPAVGPSAELLSVNLKPDQHGHTSYAELYTVDDHALTTLGLRLIEGRNFHANEIVDIASYESIAPASIIITQELAEKLFPHASAVGKVIYLGSAPSTIIGVIRHLQVPATGTNTFAFRSVLAPVRLIMANRSYYMLRARPGQLDAVLRAAPAALRAANHARLIDVDGGVRRYRDLRFEGYARDRGVAILMSMICVVLLLATAGGMVGLSSFWVSQRRRHIGIRRALGATRGDILRYFQTENFLIVSFGIVLGMALAFALNLQLMTHYELPRLPFYYLPIGALALWVLGQLAALGPALRAAAVPPVLATRNV